MIHAHSDSSISSQALWPRWLGQITLFVLVWLSLIQLPNPPSVALDMSWQMVLGHAVAHNLQHGQDIVFTYGPLGYLMATTYTGDHFSIYIVWQVATGFLITIGLYSFGRAFFGWRKFLYYSYLFMFGTCYPDAAAMVNITIFGVMLMRNEYQKPIVIFALSAALALFSLVKFTNLMLSGFILSCAALYYLYLRRFSLITWLFATYLAVFLTGWIICGQSLSKIFQFLHYGWELSMGYAGAMGVYESTSTFYIGIGICFCLVFYCAASFLTSQDKFKSLLTLSIVLGACFMNWKHGFVRADGHVFAHYVMSLMVVCTYPVLTQDNEKFGWLKGLALACTAFMALFSADRILPTTVIPAPSNWNYRLRTNLHALTHLDEFHASLDRQLKQTATEATLPTIKRFIGNESVDQLGSDQAYTLLNGFNYTPRPAVQSYTTYTDQLNRLDEAFYLSPKAPHFVLYRFGSIDGRLVSLDDSLTLKLLFQNYNYAIEESGVVLWERPQKITATPASEEKVILQKITHFGDIIEVPQPNEQPVWAVVRIKQTLLGRIRQFFYKPPTLWIDIIDQRDGKHEFQFVRAMGASGFILQPLFTDSASIVHFQQGQAPLNIKSFSLRTMPGREKFYNKDIEIELRTTRPFTRLTDGLKVSEPQRFKMTNRPPSRIHAANTIMDSFNGTEHLLQMHPTSAMEFDIGQTPVHNVHAEFGIMEGAFKGPEGTKGVIFRIEWLNAKGESELLFSQFLDPMNHAPDRARHAVDIPLGSRTNGTLVFRTLPGPSGNIAYSWSYWTAVEIR